MGLSYCHRDVAFPVLDTFSSTAVSVMFPRTTTFFSSKLTSYDSTPSILSNICEGEGQRVCMNIRKLLCRTLVRFWTPLISNVGTVKDKRFKDTGCDTCHDGHPDGVFRYLLRGSFTATVWVDPSWRRCLWVSKIVST